MNTSGAGAHEPAVAAALAAQDLAAFKRAWVDAFPAGGAVLGGVERFDQLLVNEVLRVDCERFADDRLAQLGDAAHAMAPNLGQGANSALVDAAVLAHEVCVDGGAAVGAAVTRYDLRRRPAVRPVQDAAGRLGALAERRHPLLRWLRDTTLRALAPVIGDGASQVRRMQQEDPAWPRETTGALVATGTRVARRDT